MKEMGMIYRVMTKLGYNSQQRRERARLRQDRNDQFYENLETMMEEVKAFDFPRWMNYLKL